MSLPTSERPAVEPAIEVRGISKIYTRNLRQAQRRGVAAILGEVRYQSPPDELRDGEFWALRDVSFQIERGAALGVVGRNGAGKSTLLRMVAGITQPSVGEVVRRGSVGSLLDPNAGFNPILTGRENVEVAFALLGGRRPERAMVDDIVAYAGLQGAVDHPVRTYSQGMRLRLGFSVMVHVDPDVLVIDEAIAVGDTAFQLQCMDHLHSFCRAGGALIFASHSLWLFQHLASRGIHLESGSVALEGPAEEVADHYIADLQRGSWVDGSGGPDLMEREQVLQSTEEADLQLQGTQRPVRFARVEIHGPAGSAPRSGEALSVRFDLVCSETVEHAELAFTIWTADLSLCVVADRSHAISGREDDGTFTIAQGRSSVACQVDQLPLTPGHYAVRAAVFDAPTSDIMGMIGYEDTPRWLEVLSPESPSPAAEPETDPPSPRLRPLRVIDVDVSGPRT